ncbi:MAG: N-acetyltransferase [Aliiglaciecola sp.]|uniref:GNAT family N-acetyltransferase n=1 Tax=Aliiglaciecola sp. TaxID=1872441 RepID=UPI00329761FB
MDKNTLPLTLVETCEEDLANLCSWFDSLDEVRDWGGPQMSFPVSLATLVAETNFNKVLSYKLIDSKNTMLAFGQCYDRLGRCHFARLIVNPRYRGRGFGKQLVMQLLEQETEKNSLKVFSLFVWPHNQVAKSLYLSLGFQVVDYPEAMTTEMAECDYLIKD